MVDGVLDHRTVRERERPRDCDVSETQYITETECVTEEVTETVTPYVVVPVPMGLGTSWFAVTERSPTPAVVRARAPTTEAKDHNGLN